MRIKNRGNTVIEILIATVIVGLVLTAVAASMTYSLQNSAEVQYRSTAVGFAQDVMEVFIKDKATLPWSTFSTSPASDNTHCVPSTISSITGISNTVVSGVGSCAQYVAQDNMNYYRTVTITTNAGPPSTKTVKVTVYWNVNVPGKQRSTDLTQTFYKTE